MGQGKRHKAVSSHPNVGDELSQPFGDSLQIADALPPDTAIKTGPAKRRRPDRRIVTTDGVLVAIEYLDHGPTSQEKVNQFARAKMPLLEIDVRRLSADPTDWDIQQYLSRQVDDPFDPAIRFLHVPTIEELIEASGGRITTNEVIDTFGSLRCFVPGCGNRVRRSKSGVMVRPREAPDLPSWDQRRFMGQQPDKALTLPRFSCEEHGFRLTIATAPGGYDWPNSHPVPDSARMSYSQGSTEIGGGIDVSFKIATKFETPPGSNASA